MSGGQWKDTHGVMLLAEGLALHCILMAFGVLFTFCRDNRFHEGP